jgi:hypothetical protein
MRPSCIPSAHYAHRSRSEPLLTNHQPPPYLPAEHLELGILHTSGACLGHLAPLTRLASLHCAGALRLTPHGLATLAALRLPRLESLSLVNLAWGQPGDGGGSEGGAAARHSSDGAVSLQASGSLGGAADLHMDWMFEDGVDLPPLALAVLRALPSVAPALRNLRLGSCAGAAAAPLTAALGALTALECLQLQELLVQADDLAAALTPAVRSGGSALVAVDVRSKEDLASMRAAARTTAAQVAAAAAGGGDLLQAAAGHMAVQAAAAAVGQAAPWLAAAPGGGGGVLGGNLHPGVWGFNGGGGGGGVNGALQEAAVAGAVAVGAAGAGGAGAHAAGPHANVAGRLYSYRLARCEGAMVRCQMLPSSPSAA